MRLAAFPLAALFAAANLFAQAPNPKVLMDADEQFCNATRERRLEGWMSYFAPDAAIFPIGRPTIDGKEGIRAFYEKVFGDPSFTLEWRPVKADIAASGELGYTYGTSDMKRKDASGKEIASKGKYTTIWKKQPDGSWKVALDIGTPSQ